MKFEADDCPFVLAFYDCCECLREAIRSETDWLIVAGEYTYFLNSEADDMQETKTSLNQKVCSSEGIKLSILLEITQVTKPAKEMSSLLILHYAVVPI